MLTCFSRRLFCKENKRYQVSSCCLHLEVVSRWNDSMWKCIYRLGLRTCRSEEKHIWNLRSSLLVDIDIPSCNNTIQMLSQLSLHWFAPILLTHIRRRAGNVILVSQIIDLNLQILVSVTPSDWIPVFLPTVISVRGPTMGQSQERFRPSFALHSVAVQRTLLLSCSTTRNTDRKSTFGACIN